MQLVNFFKKFNQLIIYFFFFFIEFFYNLFAKFLYIYYFIFILLIINYFLIFNENLYHLLFTDYNIINFTYGCVLPFPIYDIKNNIDLSDIVLGYGAAYEASFFYYTAVVLGQFPYNLIDSSSISIRDLFYIFHSTYPSIFQLNLYYYFYLSFLMLFAAIIAVCVDNPIFSVISLIVTFIAASFIFFSLNFQFLGLILIIIYVGAISVLFLYSVMLYKVRQFDIYRQTYFSFFFINIIEFCLPYSILNYLNLKKYLHNFLLIVLLLILCGISFFIFLKLNSFFILNFNSFFVRSSTFSIDELFQMNEIEFLGNFLFNNFSIYVIMTGYLLLVAMCSVILFTRLKPFSTTYVRVNKLKSAFVI